MTFDTVNHSISATKLIAVRIDEPSLQWFESYLSGRKQFVELNGCQSQGSKLTSVRRPEADNFAVGPTTFRVVGSVIRELIMRSVRDIL